MSDERLREIVGNFLYDLEDMSRDDRGAVRPCSISQALDQFATWSRVDSFMRSVPEDVPRWQVCLWLQDNVEERIRQCGVDEFYEMAFAAIPMTESKLFQDMRRCFSPPEDLKNDDIGEEEYQDDC